MIKTLRKRFIRIAMLAVTAVLLALCLIVNAANYISVDNSLTNMLQIISNNRGMVPQSPPGGFDKPGTRPEGGFTPETPFSTRYFVLWYDADGTLLRFDLGKIAAVTEADIAEYLQAAAKHGAGYCWVNGYRCFVTQSEDGGFMAIFLDAHRDLQTVKTTAWLSLAAMLFCVACVYLVVTLLSRRAIDPVVKASEKQKQFITDAGHELKTPITVIRQMVSILLDNAVKYASDGSPIRLTLEKGKKGPVLRTVNCCEGLTQQQADKLFDRFYRVDQSRTTGGFGIGLSMARSIAEGHKGSIKATCCEENKIEFTVSLGKCV